MPTNDNSYIIDAQSGNGFNAETFLKNYWQQKPVVIKHFFDNFSHLSIWYSSFLFSISIRFYVIYI
ncbi:MAG: hypothetical protein ACPGKV_05795, partial [Alteromonas macleodii]